MGVVHDVRLPHGIRRRQFLGYCWSGAKAYPLWTWAWVPLVGLFPNDAGAEDLIQVPSGTYNAADIFKASGTAGTRKRYQAITAGGVIVGGNQKITRDYVTADGMVFDGRLSSDPTKKGAIDRIEGAEVHLENCRLRGPIDIHRSYEPDENGDGSTACSQDECTGTENCIPSTSAPPLLAGRHARLYRCVLHGSQSIGTVQDGSWLEIDECLIRNHFNGFDLSPNGKITISNSAMLVAPNHAFSIKCASGQGGEVVLHNTLWWDYQDPFDAGERQGCDILRITHCTIGISPSVNNREHPASGGSGGKFGGSVGQVRNECLFRDNLCSLYRGTNAFLVVLSTQYGILTQDYNLFYHHVPQTPARVVRVDGVDKAFAEWQAISGKDAHSLYGSAPVFANPPEYAGPSCAVGMPDPGNAANAWGYRTIPDSLATVRGWFALQAGSPGKNAASDGLDMGMVASGIFPPAPSAPKNLRIIR